MTSRVTGTGPSARAVAETVRIRDFTGAPEAVAARLTALARADPDALPFAAGPDRARRLGLRVLGEVSGVAVGLLDAREREAHVPAWMLAQRDRVVRGQGRWRSATGEADRVAVVLFAETGARPGGADGTGLVVQWAVVSVVRASLN